MKSILIGNGVNIQFGGRAYTSEFILQRIKYKAKQDKYKELFEESISGKEIVTILDSFVTICNEIINNEYDSYVNTKDDLIALQEFKDRYKAWTIRESKDIMLEDWFFLIHMLFLKNPDLIDNRKGVIQSFERLFLDAIYNDGLIQEVYKNANNKFKKFLKSFDKIFTLNYDNNIESLTGKTVIHLHGDFSVLADSENPLTVNGFVRTKNKRTVVIPNYSHCFCNALLNYSGQLKYKKAQNNHKANIDSQSYAINYWSNPNYYDDIAESHPDAYELIMSKIQHPELPMATEYYFEELSDIDSELHILGISPNNDSHIINLINRNDNITKIIFYYHSLHERENAEKIFSAKNVTCVSVEELWEQLSCRTKKYNCKYKIGNNTNILEICKVFSEYPYATKESIEKEINTIPQFEMDRLTKIVKSSVNLTNKPSSEEQLWQYLSEISYIALREGITPPTLFLITIMNFNSV